MSTGFYNEPEVARPYESLFPAYTWNLITQWVTEQGGQEKDKSINSMSYQMWKVIPNESYWAKLVCLLYVVRTEPSFLYTDEPTEFINQLRVYVQSSSQCEKEEIEGLIFVIQLESHYETQIQSNQDPNLIDGKYKENIHEKYSKYAWLSNEVDTLIKQGQFALAHQKLQIVYEDPFVGSTWPSLLRLAGLLHMKGSGVAQNITIGRYLWSKAHDDITCVMYIKICQHYKIYRYCPHERLSTSNVDQKLAKSGFTSEDYQQAIEVLEVTKIIVIEQIKKEVCRLDDICEQVKNAPNSQEVLDIWYRLCE